MENKTDCGKVPLLSYIGMDDLYTNGKLMYIAGKEDASPGNVGTLDGPVQAQGVDIDPTNDGDVALGSYLYTKNDGTKHLRQLMFKLNTFAGAAARFSVLVPAVDCCCGSAEWVTRTADITLTDGTTSVINPRGLVQDGNFLYLADNAGTTIFIANAADLEAAADNDPVTVKSLDLAGDLDPEPRYSGRGQAAVILGDYLDVLFLDSDSSGMNYGPVSYLVRLKLDHSGGLPTFNALTNVGINAQSIIPVNDGSAVQLLIPAIGGQQWYDGGTNGTASNICYVPAEGTWLAAAPVKITGDAYPVPHPTPIPTPTAYDIHAGAGAMRDGSSALFFLTQIYEGSTIARWQIYQTTVTGFFALADNTPLSKAGFTVVDQGTINSPGYFGLYFWDLLYEQVPDADDDAGDRLWVGKGTPILVTRVPAYGSPTGTSLNPYIEFAYIGGVNVNMGAFDLLIETLNQAARGVSLKRTFRKAQAPKPTEEEIAAAKAAQAKGGSSK